TRTSRLRTITYGTSFLHFSFTATPTTAIYTLSLHDALPIYALLHPAGYYTLNNIPDGPRLKISSANVLKKASPAEEVVQEHARVDRKSTRLNSSHVKISYAVFCLKKKRKNTYLFDITNRTSV